MHPKIVITGLLAGVLYAAGLAGPLQPAEATPGDGFQISAAGAVSFIYGSELDGSGGFYSYDHFGNINSLVYVPRPAPAALGGNFQLGYKDGYWGASIHYLYASHAQEESLIGDQASRMIYSVLDFSGKLYLVWLDAWVIYGLGGVSVVSLTAENTTMNLAQGRVEDALFKGSGVHLGVGAAVYLTPDLAIYGEYIQRFIQLYTLNDLELPAPLNSGGPGSLWVGVSYAVPLFAP